MQTFCQYRLYILWACENIYGTLHLLVHSLIKHYNTYLYVFIRARIYSNRHVLEYSLTTAIKLSTHCVLNIYKGWLTKPICMYSRLIHVWGPVFLMFKFYFKHEIYVWKKKKHNAYFDHIRLLYKPRLTAVMPPFLSL